MSIDPALWPKLHGASTHFPMALTMAAALFEVGAVLVPAAAAHRGSLRGAGYYTIILGALGTFPAVLSGLFMTHGETLGHDALLFHHLFVWPAFAGIVALGTWRGLVGEKASPGASRVYLVALLVVSGLMAAAGVLGRGVDFEFVIRISWRDGLRPVRAGLIREAVRTGRNPSLQRTLRFFLS